jgi:TetR/AcrR family transcriptional regulator, repressor for uid operon
MRARDLDLNRRRKDMILEAAATCFVKQGFHSTSMKDVCVAAAMSPGTVYHYVRSKTDIIRGIIEADQAVTSALLRSLSEADDFFAALFAALDRIAADISQDDLALSAEISAETLRQADLQKLSRLALAETVADLARAVSLGQERGQIDASLAPDQAAAMLIALLDGLLWQATLFGIERMKAQLPFAKQALARMMIDPDRTC